MIVAVWFLLMVLNIIAMEAWLREITSSEQSPTVGEKENEQ